VIGLETGSNRRDVGESALYFIGPGLLFRRIPNLKFHVYSRGISRMLATLETKILFKPHGGAPPSGYYLIFSQAYNIKRQLTRFVKKKPESVSSEQ
jgi:hypothetical protein